MYFIILLFLFFYATNDHFVKCDTKCYYDNFAHGVSSIFNKECNNRPIFKIQDYDASNIEPPIDTNGFYLSPEDVSSCITTSLTESFDVNTEISFKYYTSFETTRPSCFWIVRVNTTFTVISKLIDINNNRRWTTEMERLTVYGELSMQLWCTNMNKAIFAIDSLQIKETNSENCIELIQPTTSTEMTTDLPSTKTSLAESSTIPVSTSETSVSTTASISTIEVTTLSPTIPEISFPTNPSSIDVTTPTSTTMSSTIEVTTSSPTVPEISFPTNPSSIDVTTPTSTTMSSTLQISTSSESNIEEETTNIYETINKEITKWKIISIIALIVSIAGLLCSISQLFIFYGKRKKEEQKIEDWEDSSYKWTTHSISSSKMNES